MMEWSPTKLVLHVDGFDGHFGQEMLGDPHVAMETGHVQGGVAIMLREQSYAKPTIETASHFPAEINCTLYCLINK
jgi:hypothetical protein